MSKHLIFDFDGVLADTFETTSQALVDIGEKPNLEAAKEFELKYATTPTFHGNGHTMTDEEMSELFEKMVAFGKRVHQLGVPLFKDFVEEIKKLKDTKIAIVSSGSQQYVMPAIVNSGLETTHILAFENHHSKEEKVKIVCKDWGIDISEAYYFTDTLVDVYELQKLISKDKLVGVAWGYCGKELLLKELSENFILDKVSDIRRFM